ncbi:MAG: hypothetical protein K2J47_01500 [Ruminococcus sp.]|nr:hypothetical protein [Ruminococcus sp.]
MGDLFFISVFVFVIWLASLIFKSPKEPPKPKDDPDKKTQEKFAVQVLKKNSTPEEIAEKEGYDIEHIKQWVQDYIDYAVKYSFDAKKINAHIDRLTDDIAFLKGICRKYIGDDWEEKTDYQNRTRKKYK